MNETQLTGHLVCKVLAAQLAEVQTWHRASELDQSSLGVAADRTVTGGCSGLD